MRSLLALLASLLSLSSNGDDATAHDDNDSVNVYNDDEND